MKTEPAEPAEDEKTDETDDTYAKVEAALKAVLPKGTDPMEVWEAIKGAGLTVSVTEESQPPQSDVGKPLGGPPESAMSGAPADGEPVGIGGGLEGMGMSGPPTDDLVRKAFKQSQAEFANK